MTNKDHMRQLPKERRYCKNKPWIWEYPPFPRVVQYFTGSKYNVIEYDTDPLALTPTALENVQKLAHEYITGEKNARAVTGYSYGYIRLLAKDATTFRKHLKELISADDATER